MTLIELQDLIARLYADRDARRRVDGGIEALTDRVNRLPDSLEGADLEQQARHLADVLVDLTSIAVVLGINLEEAVRYYVHGCPECGNNPVTATSHQPSAISYRLSARTGRYNHAITE